MPREVIRASVLVEAEPHEVYRYFTRAPAGEFTVDINGMHVRGHYQEVDPPHRLVISWGFAGSDELPPGASTLEVRLTSEHGGTRVEICHAGLPEVQAAEHGTGWPHFLGELATRISATLESRVLP